MNPVVTLILPCYNIESYLERCVRSILAQTFQDFEVILVDDGSTDGTGRLCDTFRDRSNFKVIHQANRGVSAARNAGLDAATGNYVLFVDPDDHIHPGLLEKVLAEARLSGADAVVFGFDTFTAGLDGVRTRTSLPKAIPETLAGNEDVIKVVLPRYIGISRADAYGWKSTGKLAPLKEFASVCLFLFKREILESNQIRFDPKLRLGEDTIFDSTYLAHCRSIRILPESLYNYTSAPTGAMRSIKNQGGELLRSKIGLMEAREQLRAAILARTGLDIRADYQGSYVISVIELATILTRDRSQPWPSNLASFKEYCRLEPIRRAIGDLELARVPLKLALPLAFMKCGAITPLFATIHFLNKLGVRLRT